MPYASAHLLGSYSTPNLDGKVEFFPWQDGSIVRIEIANLPKSRIMGKHLGLTDSFDIVISNSSNCDESKLKDMKDFLQHFLTGALPPLLSNNGYAFMSVYTNKFKSEDVIGKTVFIYGNNKVRIACGVIKKG